MHYYLSSKYRIYSKIWRENAHSVQQICIFIIVPKLKVRYERGVK